MERLPGGELLLAFFSEFGSDDVLGVAAEMAYRFLFAIFPLLLFLVAGLGFVGKRLGADDLSLRLMSEAWVLLPAETAGVLEHYLRGLLETQSPPFLAVGLVGTLWAAAGGVGALIKGLNRVYGVQTPRPLWKRQVLAVLTIVALPPLGLALFLIGAIGQLAAEWAGEGLGWGSGLASAVALARWPIVVLLLVVGLSLTYHVLPRGRRPYLASLPGSMLAAIGWILLTQGFGLYLANFANYGLTYGSFGTAMAFMLWLYLVSVVVLTGAEVNAVLDRGRRERS